MPQSSNAAASRPQRKISPRRLPSLLPATVVAGAVLVLSAAWARGETVRAESSAGPIVLEKIADFEHPWGMDFVGDDAVLVTERDGGLFWLSLDDDGLVERWEIENAPPVAAVGQGGLLDVAASPDFATSGVLYLSYAAAADDGARTAVDRAVLSLDGSPALSGRETIFEQTPPLRGGRHFGSRLIIAPDGSLFITTGDRGERPMAQGTDNHVGKVVRILPDGSTPPDNPFVGVEGYLPEIWSLGHRNIQGAALDPATGLLWTVEHGARGGDELNLPEAGLNYGWPTISYGVHYSGGRIGEGSSALGLEQPIYYWDPSIAPSGLAFHDGPLFADWNGDILVGALKDQLVARLDVEDGEIVSEERLFEGEIGRIRDVAVGPDGAIWLLTDEGDGGLWRATPAE